MKLTLKKYEQAKKAIEESRKTHVPTVKAWEDALKRIGPTGNGQIDSVEIDDETKELTWRCKEKKDVDEEAKSG